jgi:hypothetical protein
MGGFLELQRELYARVWCHLGEMRQARGSLSVITSHPVPSLNLIDLGLG